MKWRRFWRWLRYGRRAAAPPVVDITDDKLEAALKRMREAGWTVAVHNDYRVNGELHTFWLFTHPSGRWIKSEGPSDAAAVNARLYDIETS